MVGALLTISGLQAQTLGTIRGDVVDSSGARLPGVTVTVRDVNTGAERSVQTNAEGLFVVPALPSSIYSVIAELEGLQTAQAENQKLFTGQTIEIELTMSVGEVSEIITVTSESALVETSRTSSASYISEAEIENYPVLGRDFKQFALLTPTVQNDTSRGFVTMSGQRGIYTGMNIDGTSAKNAFFGYGTGGEATENDGIVVAQDSVKEFQVVTSGFAPEQGASGGGYINVVTKSGTNTLKASASYLFTDDSMKADIPATPLDKSRGETEGRPVSTFEREEIGLSVAGPIKKDKAHFFFAGDTITRDTPFRQDLRTRGAYDAILLLAQSNPDFATLVDGFTPNDDGVAAADPVNGRTATGLFTRSVENDILFGKVDLQLNQSNTLTARMNYTDYARTSTYKDEESLKTEETNSIVGSLISVIGSNAVNEFRVQSKYDDLGRSNLRVGDPIEAQIRFRSSSDPGGFNTSSSVGKFDFLPIIANTDALHFQNNFSYLFGDHDLKFGVDYQDDAMAQIFAGSKDGRYDFRTMQDLLANNATQVRIYFGNVSFPNYDEKQVITSLYAQDAWKPNPNLTLNYGVRLQMTDNPSGLTHVFAVGEEIPDDNNNWAPRFGFAYTPGGDGKHVVRGGIGLFHGRTPTLLFASQIQENGIFPNFGRVTVRPGQAGFVPLGTPIDNTNPPLTTIPSTSYFQPNFEDPETLRINLGYEREIATNWSAGVDLVYADGDNLQRNDDLNREIASRDQYGRAIYTGNFSRPDPNFNTIFVRESIGQSEYTAVTFKTKRRYTGKFQVQAHYTWSEDKSDDDNERSATGVTISDPTNPDYEFGLSSRDVENRIVVSGLYQLPYGFRISGGLDYRSGRPWTILDPNDNVHRFPGFNGPAARGIVNGELVGRNTQRNESIKTVNLRLSKLFEIGDFGIDVFGEAFNLFDDNSFSVGGSQAEVGDSEFGIADNQIGDQRQYQVGFRLTFN
jgi:outer membrane receptor protein involved in Fe transport